MKNKSLLVFLTVVVIGAISYVYTKGYYRFLKYAVYYVFPTESYISTDEILSIDVDTLNKIDRGYGDWLVHPCVRYIPNGMGGSKWWMAVTPYPEGNSKYEQPILYYGCENAETPPTEWIFYGMIQEMPQKGYNADPNIFYDEKTKMMILLWKETHTINTKEEYKNNAIMYRTFDGNKLGRIEKLFDNCDSDIVKLTCPTLLQIKDSLYCFATEFEHDRISNVDQPFGKSNLAVWKNEYLNMDSVMFSYSRVAKQIYNKGFNYWHTDFTYDSQTGLYYSVVTDESGFNLYFGVSENGFNYRYLKKPLISFRDKNHFRNIYKASIVLAKGRLFVFYPKRSKTNRSVHIYKAELDKTLLLNDYYAEK